MNALRVGNEETRKVARTILKTAIAAPLVDDDEAASEAAAKWLEPLRDQPFVQPR